jgi:hypothetical protein
MNHTTLLVGLVLTLGIPLAATLTSTFTVNAQQLSSSPSSSIPRTTTVSENVKSEMCDPSSPSLKVVNTTEARICNIPKTVKDPTTTAASTTPTESTATTPASSSSSPKQQQQIATTNNNNVISQSNSPAIGASTTPTNSVSNKSPPAPISSSTPATTIAPQAGSEIVQNPINQQQQPPIIAAVSNGTDAQNTALASISPTLNSDKLMYLGYHVGAGGITGDDTTGRSIKTSSISKDDGSTHKDHSSTKSSSHDSDKSKPKTSSQSKSDNDNDGSGDKKPKKSGSKEHKSHKGGDSFFGGDPFF